MNTLFGKKASFIPSALLDLKGGKTSEYSSPVTGTIEYVNEEHNYFTVVCCLRGETFRESFKFSQIGKDVAIRG